MDAKTRLIKTDTLGDVETVIDLLNKVIRPLAEKRGLNSWEKISTFSTQAWPRFTNQVRHPVYPGTLWERDTITSRLRSGVA